MMPEENNQDSWMDMVDLAADLDNTSIIHRWRSELLSLILRGKRTKIYNTKKQRIICFIGEIPYIQALIWTQKHTPKWKKCQN